MTTRSPWSTAPIAGGDRVEIKVGALKGTLGTVTEVSGQVKVLIDSLEAHGPQWFLRARVKRLR